MKFTCSFYFAVAAITVLCSATGAAGLAGPQPVATVKQVMKAMVEPASNAVFAAAGDPPKDEAGWQGAEYQALVLAETANLLIMQGRAVDKGEWVKQAVALREAAQLAAAAARAKDAGKLGTAGDAVYGTCETCHKSYVKVAR
jgi:hypothetical protein